MGKEEEEEGAQVHDEEAEKERRKAMTYNISLKIWMDATWKMRR